LRPLRLAGMILVVGCFQGAVAHWLAIGDAVPDFFVIAAVSVSLSLRWEQAGLAAGFIGLGRDLFLDHRLGTGAILFFLLGSFLGRLRTEIFVEHPITQMIVTLLAALILAAAQLVGILLARRPALQLLAVEAAVLSALYVAAIAPLLFRLLRRLAPLEAADDRLG